MMIVELPPFERLGRHLIEGSSDCVKLVDLDGRILEVNQRATTDLGYEHG